MIVPNHVNEILIGGTRYYPGDEIPDKIVALHPELSDKAHILNQAEKTVADVTETVKEV